MIRSITKLSSGYLLFEFVILNVCVLLTYGWSVLGFAEVPGFLTDGAGLFLYLTLLYLSWMLVTLIHGDPSFYFSFSFRRRVRYLAINALLILGVYYTVLTILRLEMALAPWLLAVMVLFAALNLFFFRFLFEFFFREKKHLPEFTALVVASRFDGKPLLNISSRIRHLGYAITGFVLKKGLGLETAGFNVLGAIHDLPKVLDAHPVDEIFIADTDLPKEELDQVVEEADFRGIRVNVIPGFQDISGEHFEHYDLDGLQVFPLRHCPLDQFNHFVLKRLFDFLFASVVLILLFPVFLLIAFLIALDGKGHIFYVPHRKGEIRDKTFKCYKFRTMSECDDPVYGKLSTRKDDPRITRIGRFLRKYDLDELPQFLNVLKGDMSVVGPRPHRVFLEEDFRRIVNDYMVRHYVKPGITGWAQVNGWRGLTETPEQMQQRIRYDLWYIENWSFWLDLKIIWMTVFGRKVREHAG